MIDVSVVAAGELQHDVTARDPTCEANRAHDGLCPRGHAADLLEARVGLDDALSQLDLGFAGCAEGQAATRRADDSFEHLGVRVAQDQRPPGAHEVDVSVTVDVPHVGALSALEDVRHTPHRAKGPHG